MQNKILILHFEELFNQQKMSLVVIKKRIAVSN